MIEIHRHLEAAPLIESLPSLVAKHAIDLPAELEALRATLLFQSRPGDLVAFLQPFIHHIYKFFKSPGAVKDFTKLSIERAHDEGIKYLELRFSPFYMSGIYAGSQQVDPEAIINAVIEGRDEAAQQWNTHVGLILIVGRELDISYGHKVIELALKYREQICGVDLAGDEYNFPPHLFEDVFGAAKANGIPISIHAGEAGPAENVRFAIERLGAARIGHGVAAITDKEVVALLKDTGVPLETCPKSNWLTGAVQGDPSNHPLMSLHAAGVKVTLNTDDPMLQGTWLADDIHAATLLGATEADLKLFQTNALEAAFIPETLRKELFIECNLNNTN